MANVQFPTRDFLATSAGATQVPDDGLGNLGQTIARGVSKFEAVKDQFDAKQRAARITSDVSERFTGFRKSYNDWFVNRSTQAGGHKTLVKEHEEQIKNLSTSAFKDIDDPETKRILTQRINEFSTRSRLNASQTSRRQEIISIQDKFTNTLQTNRDLAINSSAEELPGIMSDMKQTIESFVSTGVLSREKGQQLLKIEQSKIQSGRMLRMIQNDPIQAESFLKNNKVIPGIEPKEHIQLTRLARSMSTQKRAANLSKTVELANSDILSIRETGKPVNGAMGMAKANLNDKQFEDYLKRREFAQQYFNDQKILLTNNPTEINKLISDRKPKAGDPQFADKFKHLADISALKTKLDKERKTDPVASAERVLNISQTEKSDVEKNIDQIFSDIAPETPTTQTQQKNNEIRAVQSSWGISKANQRLLSRSTAVNIATRYDALTPAQRIQFFQGLRVQYGRDYNTVFRDLVQLGKLPAEANLFNVYSNIAAGPILAPKLSAAISMPDKEFNAVKQAIPSSIRSSIRTVIDKRISDYRNTIAAADSSGRSESAIATIKQAIEKMVILDVAAGKDYSNSATEIVLQTFNADQGGAYNYIDTSTFVGSTQIIARVPNNIDSEKVELAIQLKNLPLIMENFNPVVPTDLTNSIKDEKKRKGIYLRALRNTGRWVTRPDDSGLWLLDQRGGWIVNEKGEKYGIDFDDLDQILETNKGQLKVLQDAIAIGGLL